MIIYYDIPPESVEKYAASLCHKIAALELPNSGSGKKPFLSISQGIYLSYPKRENRHLYDCLSKADSALYEVKQQGGDSYLIYQ